MSSRTESNCMRTPAQVPHPPIGNDLEGFDVIARIAHSDAGLVLSEDKASMIVARLSKRMRALGFERVADYGAFVSSSEGGAERREMLFSLTTNVTSFLREAHHFTFFAKELLPALRDRCRAGGRIRLWSAGCSTGQEPYTIAMALLDALPDAADHDVRILATDVDAHALGRARIGRYPMESLQPLPERWRRTFFGDEVVEGGEKSVAVLPVVRNLISFRELNLVKEWPMRWPFSVIFCRNVVIYFDKGTQKTLWHRFADQLHEGGHLFIGHSERIDLAGQEPFVNVGPTIYRRIVAPSSQPDRTL